MADKIYTLKDARTGKSFDIQLSHRPTIDEAYDLLDKQYEQNQKASEASLEQNKTKKIFHKLIEGNACFSLIPSATFTSSQKCCSFKKNTCK